MENVSNKLFKIESQPERNATFDATFEVFSVSSLKPYPSSL